MKTFIIAEAGVNHNGSLELAKKLVDAAKEAGADAVKFQTFKAEKLISKYAQKAEYQKKSTKPDESQLEMVKRFELSFEEFEELYRYCRDKDITFLSSPFDSESIDFLARLGLEIFKIPSGEITNLPYLEKVGKLGKKILISTGMAYLGEVEAALNILIQSGTKKEDITVLHCNTEYPTPYEDVNLRAMLTIKEAFKTRIGYSDHTPGIEIPIAAAAMGAEVIEKHFTLDRNMEGPDHKASLELGELGNMVSAIRNIEKAMGDGIKKPSFSEMKNIVIARKSIIAAKKIRSGETFTEENLTVKRPGIGISPMQWHNILGKKSNRDYEEDEVIE